MVTYITAGAATKALRKAGYQFDLVKGKGYFWFDNRYPLTNPLCTINVDSIYEWPRLSGTVEQIVDMVKAKVDAFEPELSPSSMGRTLRLKMEK